MKSCIATMRSLNLAIKAQKALAVAGIFAKIIPLEPNMSRRGCAYGVEFHPSQENDVKRILRRAGISISQIIRIGDEK